MKKSKGLMWNGETVEKGIGEQAPVRVPKTNDEGKRLRSHSRLVR